MMHGQINIKSCNGHIFDKHSGMMILKLSPVMGIYLTNTAV